MEFSRCAQTARAGSQAGIARSFKTQQRGLLHVEVDVASRRALASDGRKNTAIKGARTRNECLTNEQSAYRGKSPGIPRKEVIQPQLPLRLPCYDFTPVTNPTFDGSLPCGLGHRLRVLPASVV